MFANCNVNVKFIVKHLIDCALYLQKINLMGTAHVINLAKN